MTLADEVQSIKEKSRSPESGRAGAFAAIAKYNQLVRDGYITEEKPKTFKSSETIPLPVYRRQSEQSQPSGPFA